MPSLHLDQLLFRAFLPLGLASAACALRPFLVPEIELRVLPSLSVALSKVGKALWAGILGRSGRHKGLKAELCRVLFPVREAAGCCSQRGRLGVSGAEGAVDEAKGGGLSVTSGQNTSQEHYWVTRFFRYSEMLRQ